MTNQPGTPPLINPTMAEMQTCHPDLWHPRDPTGQARPSISGAGEVLPGPTVKTETDLRNFVAKAEKLLPPGGTARWHRPHAWYIRN